MTPTRYIADLLMPALTADAVAAVVDVFEVAAAVRDANG